MPGQLRRKASAEAALRRMLEADDAKDDVGNANAEWEDWQRAATDYWVQGHPELQRFRRSRDKKIPTIERMRDLARRIEGSMDGIPASWRVRAPSAEKAEHLARVGWHHELMAALYEPLDDAMGKVSSSSSEVETLVRFLEADVYCHRSGYAKADVIRALRRTELDAATRKRLRGVVIRAVDGPDRREFRAYVRLARLVDDDELRTQLRARLDPYTPIVTRHARWVLEGLGEKPGR
jgi:hypothetical protein